MRVVRVGRYRIAAEVLAVAVVSAFLISGVAQCVNTATLTHTAMLAENSHKASLAAIQARRARDSIAVLHQRAVARTDSVVRSSRTDQARLTRAIDQSRLSLADTNVSRDTLQARLRETVAAAERLSVAYDSTISSFVIERAAVTAEREAWLAERATWNTLVAAKDAELAAWKDAARCRIIGPIPCPTRWQSAGLGALGALLLVVAL